jgi:hypothetical protein
VNTGVDRPMTETVLSMARALVGIAVSKAASASAAAHETSLRLGVHKEIWYVCPPSISLLVRRVTSPAP